MLLDLASIAEAIGSAVAWIGIGAFFSLWVHRAQGNRALTMGLYIVFGALSFFGFLYGLGSIYRNAREGAEFSRSALTYMCAGFAAGLPLLPPTRRLLARFIPFSPRSIPDMVGLVILLAGGTAAAVQLFFTTQVDEAPGYTALILQLVLSIALAFLAVGTFIARTFRESLERLGVVRPTLRQVGVAIALVPVAIVSSGISMFLVWLLQPDVYDRIQNNLEQVTTNFNSVGGALAIGLTAGIGEELLFRGAIQPRYGLIFTSLIFALLHIQYDASFILVGTFAAGIIFGIERRKMNTTTAIITHTLYNVVAVLLSI